MRVRVRVQVREGDFGCGPGCGRSSVDFLLEFIVRSGRNFVYIHNSMSSISSAIQIADWSIRARATEIRGVIPGATFHSSRQLISRRAVPPCLEARGGIHILLGTYIYIICVCAYCEVGTVPYIVSSLGLPLSDVRCVGGRMNWREKRLERGPFAMGMPSGERNQQETCCACHESENAAGCQPWRQTSVGGRRCFAPPTSPT